MLELSAYKKNKKELRDAIAVQLRALREKEGLSIEELSVCTGISVEILRGVEDGKARRLGHLYRLARYYDKQMKIEFY
uniref:HTH cro/C1-type domain-containing protein n=1 Tax=uncultured Alphaproteobacteria bacterium TaxID=91750 RepID=A0A6G8F223_9PROT|nr:hypothetical protein PlAlph_0510 [uncultured Alphaproteobacteria bacterium]